MHCVKRSELVNLKFSMSQEVKKGPFAALIIESCQNFFKKKLMWLYLLTTKDSLMVKV